MNKKKNNINKNKYLKLLLIIILIVLIDQIIKAIVINTGRIDIIPNILALIPNEAKSVDFSTRLMYIATNIIVLIIVFKFITTENQFINIKIQVFLSLIFAGGLSNVIDRIFRGYVVEYINFVNIDKFPVFNIADIAFVFGWIAFVAVFAAFTSKEWKEKRNLE